MKIGHAELPSASPSSRAVSASMPLRETMSSAASTISSLVNLGFGGIRSLLLLKSHVLNRLFCNERFKTYGFFSRCQAQNSVRGKNAKKEPESSVLQGFPALRVSYLFLSRISIASPKLKKRYFSRTASS